MSLIHFFITHRLELWQLIGQHLFLVFVSTAIAVMIGIPLGIAINRWRILTRPVLGFANIMQTIPSLALFGFLIPFSGIGPKTAIIALFLYAWLPIIRNTYAGIQGIDPAIREAGVGMGMTARQLIFSVEIPLALAFIIAGIRIATVISVGTATIAAVIDGGGLGRYIFRGLRMNDNILILAGAIPAALIALGADLFFSALERWLTKGMNYRKYFRYFIIFFILLVTLIFALAFTSKKEVKIAVGSKDFTEQVILGELLAQAIESKTNFSVSRHFDLGGELAHQALLAGEIDTYVEYTGTSLASILHLPPLKDPNAVYEQVKTEYLKRFRLIWAQPLGFNNTFAVLVRGKDAQKYRLTKISDLGAYALQWTAGFGQDFISRSDGYAGLTRLYNLKFKQVREMDLSFTYRALESGKIDVMVGNETDGLIEPLGFVILADDLSYFPPYDAVPVVREEVYPKIKDVLSKLEGLISAEEMRHLNFLVDAQQLSAHEAVARFLKEKNF